MLLLLYTVRAAPTPATNWDKWTALGTLALAGLTFATLAYTVIASAVDRRQAKADREAADRRLIDERKAGDDRVRAERDHAAEVRRRDRQIDNVTVLVGRVAEVQALLAPIPGAALRIGQGSQTVKDALAAISSLRHGAWTEAAMLGTREAAEAAADRYRALVRLMDEASHAQITNRYPERDMDTLRNYARWVLISLRSLAENETVPPTGHPTIPLLGLAEDTPAWLPNPLPPGWDDIARADAPVRISSQVTFGGGHKINSQGQATGPPPG